MDKATLTRTRTLAHAYLSGETHRMDDSYTIAQGAIALCDHADNLRAELAARDEKIALLLKFLSNCTHWMAFPPTSNSDRYCVSELCDCNPRAAGRSK